MYQDDPLKSDTRRDLISKVSNMLRKVIIRETWLDSK